MRTRVHGPAGRVARSARVCAPRTGGVRVYTEHTWVCTRTHAKRGGDTRWGAAGWAERAALLGGGGHSPKPQRYRRGGDGDAAVAVGCPVSPLAPQSLRVPGCPAPGVGWPEPVAAIWHRGSARCGPVPTASSPRLAVPRNLLSSLGPPPRHWASCHTAQPSLAGGLALPRGIFLWDGEEGRAGGGCGRIQSCCAACPYSLGDLQPLEELG